MGWAVGALARGRGRALTKAGVGPSCAPTLQARGVRSRDQLSSLFWGHGLGPAARSEVPRPRPAPRRPCCAWGLQCALHWRGSEPRRMVRHSRPPQPGWLDTERGTGGESPSHPRGLRIPGLSGTGEGAERESETLTTAPPPRPGVQGTTRGGVGTSPPPPSREPGS